jgi:asparagine synthetase B (glutamine-hydrolysing)
MCGLLVSKNGRGNARFIRRRGQDATGHHERAGLTFTHFLLNVTGPETVQPFISGDVVALYNGEIYNLPYRQSDGENLIPLYRERGALFPRYLDGEFAIALYDFAADRAYFIADRFATKPLWRNGIECASYESGVGGHKVQANTIEAVRISDGEDLAVLHYHEWDWHQHVTTYEHCIAAFEAAVAKRYKPGCFIGLSSGYDSGAIACALRGRDFKAYAVLASESKPIVYLRADMLPDVDVIGGFNIATQEAHLRDNAEDFDYCIRYDDGIKVSSYKEDYAAKALSRICNAAFIEGRKVCLSGGGADEILSDYSLIPRQSEFKGHYPDELREWANFTGSCQYSYLGKEECVGGSWNIETRYPFLDTEFVQSFLSLAPELKNRNYKAPLFEYLTRERFPFERDKKIGWTV